MYRITALNDSEEPEGKDVAVSVVPVQQIRESEVLKRYNEALTNQRNGNSNAAVDIYKELLETPYLSNAKPVENSQEPNVNGISPIYGKTDLNIKYSCYRNLAEIHRDLGKLSLALDFYLSALEIDGTDVTTWYKVGLLASKLGLIHLAPTAFMTGIKCSSQNWPCLDRAAISLVVEGDFPLAMEVLSQCFKINPDYQRGLALRDVMLESEPWLKTDMATLCPQAELQFNRAFGGPEEVKIKLRTEIKTLENNFQLWKMREAEKPIVYLDFIEPLEEFSWRALGESLIALYKWLEDNNESLLQRRVNLLTRLPEKKTGAVEIDTVAPVEAEPVEVEPCEKKDTAIESELSEVEGTEERRSRRRPGSALMEELLLCGKRRSTRVRTCRKEQESMSVADALRDILPRCLLQKQIGPVKKVDKLMNGDFDDESMDTMDLYKLFEKQVVSERENILNYEQKEEEEQDHDKLAESEGYYNTLQEENDVKSLLETFDKQAFLEILKAYVFTMEKSWNKTWPKKLLPVFISCYQSFRKYYGIIPQFLNYEEIRQHTYEESGATLLYHELMVDCENCGEDILPLQLMHNIVELACFPDEFPDALSHAIYELRIMWMRAHLFLARGETSDAIDYFETSLNCYTDHPELEQHVVYLRNCYRNQTISKEIVLAALDAQSRKKSLSEIVRLFNEGSYKDVADTLRDHVNSPVKSADDVQRRNKLMNMLINTLYHLDEYKECLSWLETSIYELLNNPRRKIPGENEEQEWKVNFDQRLVAIDECCEWGEFTIYDALPKSRLPRFVLTLCQAICRQLEDSERPPCASRPWMTLNSILRVMEATDPLQPSQSLQRPNSQAEDSDGESDVSDLPASVLVLFTAHEYLGRREWCNCDGNVLLFLIMDQVIPRLRSQEWAPFRETVQQYLDQVVFCLYAHPSKKPKTRNIVDHNVNSIPLTWDRAVQLYELYRPDELPSFDSLRTSIISADTEVLFRRIVSLIPGDIDLEQNVGCVEDFIYKRRDDLPIAAVTLPPQVTDIFYILGDYHFKTHDSVAALKNLKIDLSFNHYRFDSWASVALAKVSDLDSALNSCDSLENDDFLKEALAVIRCYEHSMKLDKTVCSLWIEYGQFAYTVHSFCSQRMKLESESLSLEQFEEMETTKTRMLEVAKEAFLNANNIWSKSNDEDTQDERWLHYYMLGKIAEKSGDLAYLQYYEKANVLLYDNNAQYPKKISYNTPQTLAIEAMEIYYRAHVCVIKCLELHDGEPLDEKTRAMFVAFLDKFANGPFAKHLSKTDLMKQKAKELDAAEQAKQRELTAIRYLLSGVISDVERLEESERAEIRKIVNVLVEEIVENVITAAQQPELVAMKTADVEQEISDSTDSSIHMRNAKCESVKEETELIGEMKSNVSSVHDSGFDEIDTKQKSPVDSDHAIKTDASTAGIECIDLSSDENDTMNVSKDELDDEMLRLAAFVAETHPDETKPAEVLPKRIEYEYAALGFATASALPPNVPLEGLEYYRQPVFEPYPHEQVPDDNYFYTLDDLRGLPSRTNKIKSKPKISYVKKRKRACREKASSSSGSEDNIAYADDSSAGSPSSSSSSSSSEEKEEETSKKRKKGGQRPCRPPKQQVLPKTDLPEAGQMEQGEISSSQPTTENEPVPPPEPEDLLLQQCIRAFELCAVRFPQHYKSVYRLAHFFYRSKKHRDLEKCRQLLLGSYASAFGNITGLFAENKNTNFFNGIWRLPAPDVDRPGNFASHMSRSVMLLLEVLRDLRDYKLLLQLCLQLRKVPEREKKYLREDERLPLSQQALTLSLQSLRNTVKYVEVMTLPIVLDAYRVYLRVQRHCPSKEGAFGDCLRSAFNRLGKGTTSLEQCLKFCQGELTGNRMEFPSPSSFKPKIKRTRKAKESEAVKEKETTSKALSPPPAEPIKPIEEKDTVPAVEEVDAVDDQSTAVKEAEISKTNEPMEISSNELPVCVEEIRDVPDIVIESPDVPIKSTNPPATEAEIEIKTPTVSIQPVRLTPEPEEMSQKASKVSVKPIETMLEKASEIESPKLSIKPMKNQPSDFDGSERKVKTPDVSIKPVKLPEAAPLPGMDLTPSVAELLKSFSVKRQLADRKNDSDGKSKSVSSTGSNPYSPSPVSSKKYSSAKSSNQHYSQNDLVNFMSNFRVNSGFPSLMSATPPPLFGIPNMMDTSSDAYTQQLSFMTSYIAQIQSQMLAENPVQQRKKQATPTASRINHSSSVSSKVTSNPKSFQEKLRQASLSSSITAPALPKETAQPPRAHSSKPTTAPSRSAGMPVGSPSTSLFKPQVYSKPTFSSKVEKVSKSLPGASKFSSDAKRQSPTLPKAAEPATAPKAKFNIDELLKKNPGISISSKKSVNQSEAMNLCAKDGSVERKRPAEDDGRKSVKKPAPEIVVLDD